MVTFYFDTSALVKRYRKEVGSDILDKISELKAQSHVDNG
jgi:predicted nucleic acid-binding protein